MTSAPGGAGQTVVVVGGTGFIGGHLVEALAARGAVVRAASRGGRWPWGAPPPGVELIALDLADPGCGARLAEALAGAQAAVHCAGPLGAAGRTESDLRRVHVGGTERLCAALPPATRLLHVSTTGVLGPTGATPLDESAPARPSNAYERAKLDGERRARDARRSGRPVVIARPGLVFGPRDLHLAGFFRAVRDGRFRLIGGGTARWQPVHVRDLAAALADLALGEGPGTGPPATGDEVPTYHLAGASSVTVAEFARLVAAATGGRIARPGLPTPVARGAGLLLETVCPLIGIDPPLSRGRVRTLTETRLYDIGRARRELGFAPATPLAAGLAETAAWYRDHGRL